MSPSHAGTVVIGQVVLRADANGLDIAEAIGIAEGRVISGQPSCHSTGCKWTMRP